MSRLFRRPSTKAVRSQHSDELNSALSSLLTPVSTIQDISPSASQHAPQKPPHRRSKSSPGVLNTQAQDQLLSRPWLSLVIAERHRSQTGDRRKLVKDPGPGSARPSFSHELVDHAGSSTGEGKEDGKDREKGAGVGMVRRGVERIRELYRREKG